MSSYAKRESHFERMGQEIVNSRPADEFFEKVKAFRAEIASEVDLGHVHTFRTRCAELHIDQYKALKGSRGALAQGSIDRFFDDLLITPQLMFELTQISFDPPGTAEAQQHAIWLSRMLVNKLPFFDFANDSESYLLSRSLRQLSSDLVGTGFEHFLAEAYLTTPVGGALRADVVIKTYLEMSDREVIDYDTAEVLWGIDVSPEAGSSAISWLRAHEAELIEAVIGGKQARLFKEALVELAEKKGFPGIAWAMRNRQQDYAPTSILKNIIDHGTYPDEKLIAMIEDESIPISMLSRLNSHSALIAYCLVHDADSSVFNESKFLQPAKRRALQALASLGLDPHEARLDMVLDIAQTLIGSARSYDDVSWLSQVKCLSDMLKGSRKFQGMRLESDLGM